MCRFDSDLRHQTPFPRPPKRTIHSASRLIRARIDRVIERFVDDNLGDHKGVGDGVIETRINTGPGYRIFYGRDGDGETVVLLLAGSSKKRQNADICNAKERWKDYKERKRRGA